MPENTNATPEQPTGQPVGQPVPAPKQQQPEAQKPPEGQAQQVPEKPVEQPSVGLQKGVDQLKQVNVQELFKPKEGQPKVTSEEKLWALISYIPLLALMVLILKPKSDYIRLHGRQGLLLFLIFFFCIFVYIVPFIGPLVGGLIQLAIFILGLYSMYQAFIGNWWKIPILGDLAAQLPLDFLTKVTTEAITGQPAGEKPVEEPKQEPTPPPPPSQEQPPPQTPQEQLPPQAPPAEQKPSGEKPPEAPTPTQPQ